MIKVAYSFFRLNARSVTFSWMLCALKLGLADKINASSKVRQDLRSSVDLFHFLVYWFCRECHAAVACQCLCECDCVHV
jgi:hypothetical protein